MEAWQIEKGQVWRNRASSASARIVVEGTPNEFKRVDIKDERTQARSRVHVSFFDDKVLIERLAVIESEERSFA